MGKTKYGKNAEADKAKPKRGPGRSARKQGNLEAFSGQFEVEC